MVAEPGWQRIETAPGLPKVYDVRLGRVRALRPGVIALGLLVALALFIGGMVLHAAIWALPGQWLRSGARDVAWYGIVVLLAVVFFAARRRVWRGRLSAVFERLFAQPTLDDLIAALAAPNARAALHLDYAPADSAGALARRLGSSEHAPVVVRCLRPEHCDAIRGLNVPFEPLPLDETHPAVRALLAESPLTGCAEPPPAASRTRDGAGETLLAGRRFVELAGGRRIVGLWAVCVLIATTVAWSRAWAARRVTFSAALWTLLLMVPLLGLLPGFGPATRALVVPGGLLRRTRAGWRLYDRRSGVLVAVPGPHNAGNLVFAADRDGVQVLPVTRQELRFLLAAWLSPLDPPTPDLVAALNESAGAVPRAGRASS